MGAQVGGHVGGQVLARRLAWPETDQAGDEQGDLVPPEVRATPPGRQTPVLLVNSSTGRPGAASGVKADIEVERPRYCRPAPWVGGARSCRRGWSSLRVRVLDRRSGRRRRAAVERLTAGPGRSRGFPGCAHHDGGHTDEVARRRRRSPGSPRCHRRRGRAAGRRADRSRPG